MLTVSVSVKAPGVPVLPLSLVSMVRVESPVPENTTLCSVLLTSVNEPVMTTVLVAEPETVAAPDSVAARVPVVTERVVVMMPAPASTSATDRALPFKVLKAMVPATADCEPGTVLTGASLTAVTLRVKVLSAKLISLLAPPLRPLSVSLTVITELPLALAAPVKVTWPVPALMVGPTANKAPLVEPVML